MNQRPFASVSMLDECQQVYMIQGDGDFRAHANRGLEEFDGHRTSQPVMDAGFDLAPMANAGARYR